jgi:N-acetylmuramoyl-L-alanine amidase
MIDSHKLGIDIMNNVLKSVRKKGFYLKDGGVRPAPFWVLVGTQMPAILIETGYLTNPQDARNLFNPIFQWQMAKGIANGIKSYFLKNR